MAKKSKRHISSYTHADKARMNNPQSGEAAQAREKPKKKTYAYDPHLTPNLEWAGKAERMSFEVPVQPLHVHERIEPAAIMEAVRRRNGMEAQGRFNWNVNQPEKERLEFYQHKQDWSNRLIAGDSLLVMNSLLEKEGMGGQVQMVYMDPPYGIKYGSNFQPSFGQREVKDRKDADLTREPEMIKAFRDTWEMGIHSYLSYMRDRLLLAKDLLHESGSCFVQISDDNVHLIRCLMDEVFGSKNFVSLINYTTTSGLGNKNLETTGDYIIWYSKDINQVKTRTLWLEKNLAPDAAYRYLELEDGATRAMTKDEREGYTRLPPRARIFRFDNITSQSGGEAGRFPISLHDEEFKITRGSWKTHKHGIENLKRAGRLGVIGNTLSYIRHIDDFPAKKMTNIWTDTSIAGFASSKKYVVETSAKVIQRCLLMTTDPGDLVLDPTCGSGTTAHTAERWGRRWITCDTSRVALAITRQTLATETYDYYQLQDSKQGIGSGFSYETVPHITLRDIANNQEIDVIHKKWQSRLDSLLASLNRALDKDWQEWEAPREGQLNWPPETINTHAEFWKTWLKRKREIDEAIKESAGQETLYDKPEIDKSKARITGPFTYEAVPSPVVQPMDEGAPEYEENMRLAEWCEELEKNGIRAKGGEKMEFSSVELYPLPALHARAETKTEMPQRAAICFGPEHAPLSQYQVADAIEAAKTLEPPVKLLVFAAFQFDPEAGRQIDTANGQHGFKLLKACMNPDLGTEDLRKKDRSSQSFWLIGTPEIEIKKEGEEYRVRVEGFVYYDSYDNKVDPSNTDKIAMWMLDTDYDGRSLCPQQIFFPMAGAKGGWQKLAKSLKAEIDESLVAAYHGTESLPFSAGEHRRIAVKIMDDCGLESVAVEDLD